MQEVEIGKYRHYKGGFVEVLGIAHHSESIEEFVVYKTLYENRTFGMGSIWIRPKSMFLENIIVAEKVTPRFEYVSE
ncbi:DUF1653 domain-containing protein [Candidatus Uhrbacteria bacterium]|nr:DUF1653 domain-containing protein [Candidatus Uhrbacteria bacterium]